MVHQLRSWVKVDVKIKSQITTNWKTFYFCWPPYSVVQNAMETHLTMYTCLKFGMDGTPWQTGCRDVAVKQWCYINGARDVHDDCLLSVSVLNRLRSLWIAHRYCSSHSCTNKRKCSAHTLCISTVFRKVASVNALWNRSKMEWFH